MSWREPNNIEPCGGIQGEIVSALVQIVVRLIQRATCHEKLVKIVTYVSDVHSLQWQYVFPERR